MFSSRILRVILWLVGSLAGVRDATAQRSSRPAPKTTSEIAQRAVPASVTVLAIGTAGDTIGIGSGFVVRSDGVVLTNHHVLAGAASALIIRSNGEVLDRVSVLDVDSIADIALLKATAIGLPVLALEASSPIVGQKVVVIGAPLGLEHTVSEGIVSAVRIEGGRERIQMSAPISPGSSGGPVIDSNLRVVAITRSTIRSGQALNFAIPARYALALLAEVSIARQKTVAEVFAARADASSEPQSTRRADARPARLPTPQSAAARRNALVGTFLTQMETSYAANQRPDSVVGGLLVMTEDGIGFWRPRYTDNSFMLAFDAVSTATGRVGIKMGTIALEGWVTDSGFYMAGEDATDKLLVRFTAEPFDLPLANPAGAYDLSVRTRYTAGAFTGDPINWTGVAAVMASSDSLLMHISLRNASGGSTGALIRTHVGPKGAFSWRDETKSASGFVRNGRLEIDWVDRRGNNVVLRGVISGQRR